MIPVPTLCRLEYLTPTGWAVGHAGVNLLNPSGYVERLEKNRKFGRAIELGDNLQPTGQIWSPKGPLPNPSTLVPSDTHVPRLPDPAKVCPLCDEEHRPPFDGRCLL